MKSCADLLFELKDEGSKLKRSKLDSDDFCAAFNVVDDSHPCLSFSSRMRLFAERGIKRSELDDDVVLARTGHLPPMNSSTLNLFFGRGIKSSEPEDDVQPGDLNNP